MGSSPGAQLTLLREVLAQQGASPADADLGLALLQAKGLAPVVADFPSQEQQALGLLLIRLAESSSLLAAFAQAPTASAAVDLATAQGITISTAILEALQQAPQELDDEALAQVTGGVVGALTVGLGVVATVFAVLTVANQAEAFLYSDSSSFLGDDIRNTGKTVLGLLP